MPLLGEWWNDRLGDDNKLQDGLIVGLCYLIISAVAQWYEIWFWRPIALAFGYRIMFFDYVMNIILYRNHIIEGPLSDRWWEYMGKTAKFDKWSAWAQIDWVLRLIFRIVLFIISLMIFIYG